MNFCARPVIATWTVAPALSSRRTSSAALYAAMPPPTPTTTFAPVSANALQVAREAANRVIDDFLAGKVDRVYLAYNEFKSAGSQVVRVAQILPVVPGKQEEPASQADYIYEPSKQALLTRLVPLYVQIQIYRSMLESIAGFFGAQMMAMENATKNAGEMINRYTLQYNRARQAAITKELLEIIGGAEALKG